MKNDETHSPPTCEFCNVAAAIAILYENRLTARDRLSVHVCAECLGELILGHDIADIFGWTWSITDGGKKVTARAIF